MKRKFYYVVSETTRANGERLKYYYSPSMGRSSLGRSPEKRMRRGVALDHAKIMSERYKKVYRVEECKAQLSLGLEVENV